MSQTSVTPALRVGEFVPLIALLISLVAPGDRCDAAGAAGHRRRLGCGQPQRRAVRHYGGVPGDEHGPDRFRSAVRSNRAQAGHPCRPGAVHGRVPHEHFRAQLRDDDRGTRAAGHRRVGAAGGDDGAGARPVRRASDGAPDVVHDGRIHHRSDDCAGAGPVDSVARGLAGHIRGLLCRCRGGFSVVRDSPAGNPPFGKPAAALPTRDRQGDGGGRKDPGRAGIHAGQRMRVRAVSGLPEHGAADLPGRLQHRRAVSPLFWGAGSGGRLRGVPERPPGAPVRHAQTVPGGNAPWPRSARSWAWAWPSSTTECSRSGC